MRDLAPGDHFAGLRIDAVAGRGGMGVVYVATHVALQKRVALKLIAPELAQDTEFRERFKRESRTAAAIDHPHVIPILHAGEDEGRLYVTMRYVDGEDLRALIKRLGRLQPEMAAAIIAQVADALDEAHSQGLVHRDVKPGNVLIEWRSGTPHAFLTDFGLTKHATSDSALTKTGVVVGTVDYMAPEQITGQRADSRSDVYALGCVLYHALCGCVPFERDTPLAALYAHTHTPPPPLSSHGPVPEALEHVVARAMAKDPAERFPSAGDLGKAAVAAASGSPLPSGETSVATGEAATRASTPPPPPPPVHAAPTAPLPRSEPAPSAARGRSRAPWIAAAVALIVLGVGAALLATSALNDDADGGRDGAGEVTTGPADRSRRAGPPPLKFETHRSVDGGFEAELPAGPGWGTPVESRPNSEIHRTRLGGPGGLGLLVDSTPNLPAELAGGTGCKPFEHPRFPLAQECSYEGGALPECQDTGCVDILLNVSEEGPGYAVLVGGGPRDTVETIARRVARSLRPG